MLSRRRFLHGLGLATIAACKKTPRSNTDTVGSAAQPTVADAAIDAPAVVQPRTPGAGDLPPTGWFPSGRSPFALDGEELIELGTDVVIRRDAKLGESSRLTIPGARSVAVLRDRSLLVLADASGKRSVHHVVGGKVVLSHASLSDLVLPTASPGQYWAVSATSVKATAIGAAEDKVDLFLPENTYAQTAFAAADGSLVMANLYGILRIDRAITTHAWDNKPDHLGPGPEPTSVWAALPPIRKDPPKLALLRLGKDRASVIASHPIGDAIVHAAGGGEHGAVITARTLEPGRATFTLIVFDAKGERWRVALDEAAVAHHVVLTPTRALAMSRPAGMTRAFDLATGKPS